MGVFVRGPQNTVADPFHAQIGVLDLLTLHACVAAETLHPQLYTATFWKPGHPEPKNLPGPLLVPSNRGIWSQIIKGDFGSNKG